MSEKRLSEQWLPPVTGTSVQSYGVLAVRCEMIAGCTAIGCSTRNDGLSNTPSFAVSEQESAAAEDT